MICRGREIVSGKGGRGDEICRGREICIASYSMIATSFDTFTI